jgi:hypothetical protein
MWKVQVWEFEKGWGNRLDSVEEFKTVEEANRYQQTFNAKNDLPEAPDWYMAAYTPYFEEDK